MTYSERMRVQYRANILQARAWREVEFRHRHDASPDVLSCDCLEFTFPVYRI